MQTHLKIPLCSLYQCSRHDSGGEVEPCPAVVCDRRPGRYSGRHAARRLPRGHAQDPAAQVRLTTYTQHKPVHGYLRHTDTQAAFMSSYKQSQN